MTDYREDLQKLSSTLEAPLTRGANVKSVFGEPIIVGKKTVIPVAHLRYGFGGGLGSAEDEETRKNGKGEKDKGSGGGFGAGLGARPAGVVEITKKQTRFIPYKEGRNVGAVLALGLGVALGLMLGRALKQ